MNFPVELGLIILFSILGGVFAVRFKQPAVLGLILVGAVIGPNALGIIHDVSLVEIAIEVGAVLLMFTIGTEFSLSRLLKLGTRVIVIAGTKIGLAFLVVYYTSVLLGFNTITSLYLGVILSITSTVILVKILEGKGFSKNKEFKLLIAILILEDIFGVFALTFFSNLNSNVDLQPFNLIADIMFSLTVLVIAYFVLQKLLKPFISWLIKYSTEDTITFTSLGLCGGMTYLALLLNLSPSVGAFLAGNIVSTLPKAKTFENAIKPFTLAFTSLFFFSIGTTVNFTTIISQFFIIIVLLIVWVITVFLTIGFGSYVFANFSGKEAVFSGIAMLTIGEFSLLIAKEAAIVNLGIDLISIVAAIIFISAIVMPFIIGYQEKIYHVTKKLLPIRLVDEMRLSLKFINNISFSMFSRRMDMRNIYSDRRKIFYNFMALLVMSIAGFWIWRFFGQDIMIFERGYILYLFIMLIVIAILFPVVNILRNGWKLFKDTLQFFTQLFPQEQCDERSIFRNILLLALFFLLFLAYTFSFAFFNIHPLLHVLSLLLLAFVLYYLLRCSRLIRKVGGKHLSSLDKSSKKYQKIITDKIYGNEEKK